MVGKPKISKEEKKMLIGVYGVFADGDFEDDRKIET